MVFLLVGTGTLGDKLRLSYPNAIRSPGDKRSWHFDFQDFGGRFVALDLATFQRGKAIWTVSRLAVNSAMTTDSSLSGVFAHLVMALVFKSTQGVFRVFGLSLGNRCKYLLLQVVAATISPVDIVG